MSVSQIYSGRQEEGVSLMMQWYEGGSQRKRCVCVVGLVLVCGLWEALPETVFVCGNNLCILTPSCQLSLQDHIHQADTEGGLVEAQELNGFYTS